MGIAIDPIRDHAGVLADAATWCQSGAHGPAAAGICYRQRPGRHLWSRLLTRITSVTDVMYITGPSPYLDTVGELVLET